MPDDLGFWLGFLAVNVAIIGLMTIGGYLEDKIKEKPAALNTVFYGFCNSMIGGIIGLVFFRIIWFSEKFPFYVYSSPFRMTFRYSSLEEMLVLFRTSSVDQYLLLFTLGGMLIGAMFSGFKIHSFNKERLKKKKERIAYEEEKVRREKRLKETEEAEDRNRMISLREESISIFEEMVKQLSSAEKYLDQAEARFSDRVFVPFWEAIESAARSLAYYKSGVNRIKNNLSSYRELSAKYGGKKTESPLSTPSLSKMGSVLETAERMNKLVYKAHKDYQFANIFVKVKTNKILVAGFENLADTLENMKGELQSSIDNMEYSYGGSIDEINTSIVSLSKLNQWDHTELTDKLSSSADREKRILSKLRELEEGRSPSIRW